MGKTLNYGGHDIRKVTDSFKIDIVRFLYQLFQSATRAGRRRFRVPHCSFPPPVQRKLHSSLYAAIL